MKQIKFRAWDGKRMSSPFNIANIQNDGDAHYNDWTSEHPNDYYFYISECTIMQFTGLHDKNGKEIYEGDILRHPVNYVEPVELQTFEMFGVSFENGAFVMSDSNGERLWDWNECAEVIGNIYENPELLTA